MNDKKTIILIILSVGAVASLIYGITAGPGKKAPDSGHVLKTSRSLPGGAISTERLSPKTDFDEWGANPFLAKRLSDSTLVLNGIVWDKTNPQAIINDEILGVGDVIGKNKVVSINQDSVMLNDGTADLELKLREE